MKKDLRLRNLASQGDPKALASVQKVAQKPLKDQIAEIDTELQHLQEIKPHFDGDREKKKNEQKTAGGTDYGTAGLAQEGDLDQIKRTRAYRTLRANINSDYAFLMINEAERRKAKLQKAQEVQTQMDAGLMEAQGCQGHVDAVEDQRQLGEELLEAQTQADASQSSQVAPPPPSLTVLRSDHEELLELQTSRCQKLARQVQELQAKTQSAYAYHHQTLDVLRSARSDPGGIDELQLNQLQEEAAEAERNFEACQQELEHKRQDLTEAQRITQLVRALVDENASLKKKISVAQGEPNLFHLMAGHHQPTRPGPSSASFGLGVVAPVVHISDEYQNPPDRLVPF